MPDNTSPEDRLLRLIRTGQKNSGVKKKRSAQPIKSLKSVQPAPAIIKKCFPFHLVSVTLRIIVLILAVYLLLDLLLINPGKMEQDVLKLTEVKEQPLEIPQQNSTAPAVSYYTNNIDSRNLFSAATYTSTPAAQSVLSTLKLQGIVSGDNAQAIVEDTTLSKVYFLSPNEPINGLELLEILPGKVRIRYHGQELELAF